MLPPIEALERAFAQLFTGSRDPQSLAVDLQIAGAELQRLFELYRSTGRGALGLPRREWIR